ncbi:MAG: hypothetical protein IPQ09_07830 [Myxococcales bacterium]|nr:hypothetical protein [Myxococcales bacterium]HQY63467.1 hypothetical protein [Polyangiaceae bacterium]
MAKSRLGVGVACALGVTFGVFAGCAPTVTSGGGDASDGAPISDGATEGAVVPPTDASADTQADTSTDAFADAPTDANTPTEAGPPDAADAADAAVPCGVSGARLCKLGEICGDEGDCAAPNSCLANVCALAPCAQGTYHDPPGSATCTPCGDNFSTPGTGSLFADCVACVAPQISRAATGYLCVDPPPVALDVVAGLSHSCALLSDGSAKCWGSNSFGQLGDSTTTNRATPVPVLALGGPVAALTATTHTCARFVDGAVKCWGLNSYGEVGDASVVHRRTPVAVNLGATAISVAAGAIHTCAALTGGAVKCWGQNATGQLGDNTTTLRTSPVSVVGLGGVATAVSAGDGFSCALLDGGAVKCWGGNNRGQLGDTTTTQRNTPVAVSGLSGAVVALSSGGSHTCALLADDTVQCWGWNNSGELGDGTRAQRTSAVALVGLGGTPRAVSAGVSHTCARLSDGAIKCWGGNTFGSLGDGTATQQLTPVSVSSLGGTPIALSAGQSNIFHSCAALGDGTVKCWGDNGSGQVGDGTSTRRLVPTLVSGIP